MMYGGYWEPLEQEFAIAILMLRVWDMIYNQGCIALAYNNKDLGRFWIVFG